MLFRSIVLWSIASLIGTPGILATPVIYGKDYIVVIAGGPTKEQNQASMEANVLFFQKLLGSKKYEDYDLTIFFADGQSPERDLQILVDLDANETASSPLRSLLAGLNRRGGPRGVGPSSSSGSRRSIAYRDHKVKEAKTSSARRIRETFRRIGTDAKAGDRVLIYVTAHGGSDKKTGPDTKENSGNTSIYCWDGEIRVQDLARWLAPIPQDVPIYHVMAQCYTGGFANLIFEEPCTENKTLSKQRHIGFFAQQQDLPAAGCRPDIEVDEEYSSYFWGAVFGESRNGVRISNADLNKDGEISFSEAHAFAVASSKTIDIPLKSSDLLLKLFSRLVLHGEESVEHQDEPESTGTVDVDLLSDLSGSIENYLEQADLNSKHIVQSLCEELQIPTDIPISKIDHWEEKRYEEVRLDVFQRSSLGLARGPETAQQNDTNSDLRTENQVDEKTAEENESRNSQDSDEKTEQEASEVASKQENVNPPRLDRGGGRRGGFGRGSRSARRELLAEIESRWPGLRERLQEVEADSSDESKELDSVPEESHKFNENEVFKEIESLEAYKRYSQFQKQMELLNETRLELELVEVKFRRLRETLALIVLEANLERIAAPEVVAAFKELKVLEQKPWFSAKGE